MTRTRALFFGMTTIDCIYLADQPPGCNEKIVADRQLICAGGPGTNAAMTFNALGGKATLISCLGLHPLASVAHNELKLHGVDHMELCPEFSSVPTMSSILVSKDTGDRSVVSVNSNPIQSHYPDMTKISLHGYTAALFDGQYMTLATALAGACRQAGIHTVLDGGSWKPGTEKLIRHIDTAICSSNFMPPGISDSENILIWLQNRGVSEVAITRGAGPILAAENGTRFEVLPPQITSVRDTLAAGDIFHGAFTYYYSKNPAGKFSDHLKKAAVIAAGSCIHFGPRKWMNDLPAG
ncbi:MAG: sugar kinase [Deltaproteobacteria bacterium]|nr:MAG: sugar kinase [Deltaproteobacteria bacterium]